MSDNSDVGEFHKKFGLATSADGSPRELPPDAAEFRLRFLLEEIEEIANACGFDLGWSLCYAGGKQDLPAIADGLADLAYVAHGTAHLFRIPWDDVWREVQRANMTKERATHAGDTRSKRAHALDVVKPVGFRPPDVVGQLMAAGWPGPRLPIEEGQ